MTNKKIRSIIGMTQYLISFINLSIEECINNVVVNHILTNDKTEDILCNNARKPYFPTDKSMLPPTNSLNFSGQSNKLIFTVRLVKTRLNIIISDIDMKYIKITKL
jgi:hypothetical protein